jgi:hypothetical protein
MNGGREDEMRNRSLVPRPWWQVGLTALPGLIFLLRQVFSPLSPWDARLHALLLATMILLSISSVLLSAMRRSLKVPVWGLIPLGLFAGMGLMSTIDPFRFYLTCFLLAVTGLLFAWHNGLSAGLFVLAGGIMTTSWAVEPVMYFWDSPFWSTFINVGLTVLLTILTPILVLRSRSIIGRVVGLLSPMAAYSAAFVFALSSVRGIPVSQSAFTAGPFIALMTTTAIAAALYEWISSRDLGVGEGQEQGAV